MKVCRIEYENGVYTGEVIMHGGDPIEDGSGAFVWSNGDIYAGQFVNGVRTGRGSSSGPTVDHTMATSRMIPGRGGGS
jgi:hypothetical protein